MTDHMQQPNPKLARRTILAAGISVSALAVAAIRRGTGGAGGESSEWSGINVIPSGGAGTAMESSSGSSTTSAATAVTTGDFPSLRDRYFDLVTGGRNLPVAAPYTGFVTALDSQVSFYLANLNEASGRTYLWNDQASGTGSANMTQSFVRLRAMAIQYVTNGSSYRGRSDLLSKTIAGLQWLSDNKYKRGAPVTGNWWDWEIGSPLAVLDAVVALRESIPATLLSTLMDAVDYFVAIPKNQTGANLAWQIRCTMLHAIVVGNVDSFNSARNRLLGMFVNVTSGDGFYADGSFIQHGSHPYTAGYGIAMVFQLAWLVYLIGGPESTLIAPSEWTLLRTWVWNNCEPLLFRGAFSPSTLGRNIARNYSTDHSAGAAFIAAVILLQDVASSNDKAVLRSLVKSHVLNDTTRSFFTYDPVTGIGSATLMVIFLGWGIRNDASVASRPEPRATTIFPRMDRIVHRAPGWALNVSMFSARTANYESINGENLHGWYTANGTAYFYNPQKLDHFQDDYWPTVDPYRLPGTTVDKRPRGNGESDGSLGQATSMVGGVSDQDCGVGVMTVNRDGGTMFARKSYIFIGDYIVCQGSGITNTSGYGVETVIENRNIGASGTNQVLMNNTTNHVLDSMGTSQLAANWLHIEGLGGLVFKSGNPTIYGMRSERSGRWSDINSDSRTPSDFRTRRYLTLWFDHGANPSGGSYGYAFMPNATAGATSNASASNLVRWQAKPLSHLAYAQFSDIDVYGVAFWAAEIHGIFQANAPVVVIVRVTNGRMAITLSDPLQTQTSPITVTAQLPSSGIVWTSAAVTASRTSSAVSVTLAPSGLKGQSGQAVFTV